MYRTQFFPSALSSPCIILKLIFFVTSTLQDYVSQIRVLRIDTLHPQEHSAGGGTAHTLLNRTIASY